MLDKLKTLKLNYILILFLLFTISIIIRFILCLSFEGPFLFFDEYYYKENALYLTNLKYFTQHYPPLYSIFLMPAFLFNDFYTSFKAINVIISSVIVFPVWLLSREFIDKKYSLILSILSLLLPFHFVYNKMVMSENLFYPLYIFSLYFLVKQLANTNRKWGVLAGLSIALSILTRYYAVVLIPIYTIVYFIDIWHYKSIGKTDVIKEKIISALISFTVLGVILLVVFIPNIDYLNTRSEDYLEKTDSVAWFFKFLVWFIIYIFYVIIIIVPFLYLIISRFNTYLSKDAVYKYRLYLYILFISSFFYVALAADHSSVNEINETYLNGRYVMYLGIPWMIFAFFPLSKKEFTIRNRLLIFTISISLVIISILIFKGKIFNTALYLLIPHMSPGGYIFIKGFYVFFGMLIVLFAMYAINSGFKKHGVFLDALNRKKNYSLAFLIVFQLIIGGLGLFILNDPIKIHGHQLLMQVKESSSQTIYNGTKSFNYQFMYFMNFYNKKEIIVKNEPIELDSCINKGYLITLNKNNKLKELSTYQFKMVDYYIYKTPLLNSHYDSTNLLK